MSSKVKTPIKEGALVTIDMDENIRFSNTYKVSKKIDDSCVLTHPLAPDCYLIKQDGDLNNTFPSMQSPIEKCLFFARNHKDLLGHTMASDLDALCYFFVIRKTLSTKQRSDIGNICGKIASIVLNNSISSAVMTIKENKVLLDEYNHSLFNSIRKVIDDPLSIKSKNERYMLFNIAGFTLAQMNNY